MNVINLKDRTTASQYVAIELLKQIKSQPNAVLGLATGSTMIDIYKYLSELINVNHTKLNDVVTFNLDEYIGLAADHEQSYHAYMKENLFNHINIDENNTNIPSGFANDIKEECQRYDKLIEDNGGIDIQILGIGSNAHIAFNEPSDTFKMGTYLVDLTESTIEANSRFFDSKDKVPTKAITMGVGSIFKAKKIILLASGKNKAEAVYNTIHGDINPNVPSSILKLHPDVTLVLDEESSALIK